jgi:hypothetical protein
MAKRKRATQYPKPDDAIPLQGLGQVPIPPSAMLPVPQTNVLPQGAGPGTLDNMKIPSMWSPEGEQQDNQRLMDYLASHDTTGMSKSDPRDIRLPLQGLRDPRLQQFQRFR